MQEENKVTQSKREHISCEKTKTSRHNKEIPREINKVRSIHDDEADLGISNGQLIA
jgi:hypothetical protein